MKKYLIINYVSKCFQSKRVPIDLHQVFDTIDLENRVPRKPQSHQWNKDTDAFLKSMKYHSKGI